MTKIVCTVTTDLNYDQRMKRICTSLSAAGYDVLLVGRKRPFSEQLTEQPYEQHRLNGRFEKGFLFYAEFNIRLFFFLLSQKLDVINTIDLDSITACFCASRVKNKTIIYDAHEYFTEMEEVVERPFVKKVWTRIEKWTVPKIKFGYTVSRGYARLFQEKYGVDYQIVRNVSERKPDPDPIQNDRPYILYQGAVNVGRGLKELILAMHQINDHELIICGLGNAYDEMRELVKNEKLDSKVTFKGYVDPDELKRFTVGAKLGFTLFSNAGLSNQHSLANRFFDYYHSGIPQIAMKYPEYENFNREFEVAKLIDSLDPETLASAIKEVVENEQYRQQLIENAKKAREVHNWQKDEKTLLEVYERALSAR